MKVISNEFDWISWSDKLGIYYREYAILFKALNDGWFDISSLIVI